MNSCDALSLHTGELFGSLWFRAVQRSGWTEYLIGATPAGDSSPSRWTADLGNFLLETGAVVVEVDGFGDADRIAETKMLLEKVLGVGFPASWMIRAGNRGAGAGGILIRAVLGVEVRPVMLGSRILGYQFEDGEAAWCYLGGLVPEGLNADGAGQTEEVMATILSCLTSVGMNFRDVVRTWYYLDGILDWYGDFNSARTAFFNRHDVFSNMMPASTGIGIANDTGGLVLAKVHACRAKSQRSTISVAESPLQCSAYAYGSAFSRAVRLTAGGVDILHISGTASIAPGGETDHLGDVAAQIQLTMEVVAAILRSAGMGWSDSVRGIAYFRDAEELHRWEAVRVAWGLPENAVLAVHADVCRDDLLFELELEAVK
jgi:enamine deaminase RidA (YjgF/YER057c/UK114 family)